MKIQNKYVTKHSGGEEKNSKIGLKKNEVINFELPNVADITIRAFLIRM